MGTCPRSSERSSPPRIVLHTANVLRATEIQTWGRDTATILLAVAHFKTWGPVYDDALSQLDDTQGPLLLMLPTDLAAALRQELDSCDGLRVGWEAVTDGNLLALLQRDAADECQGGMLAPHLTGRHVYMATPPQGHLRLAWDDLIAAFHDHSPRRHVAGGPARDARQGLPAPRPRPPAGDPEPRPPEVG